jgi:DNA-binding PadR family transcriptional regulator
MPPRIRTLPHNQERYALQLLLSGQWKPSSTLQPTGDRTLNKMVEKGWLERRVAKHFEYRITEAGREAFHSPLPR